jgi:hypothetical protein
MGSYNFASLTSYLERIPAINKGIGTGVDDNQFWWVKFSIDIHHRLAWHVIQELGHVLNYLSLDEKLPTAFFPVSPPPYLNGGPEDYLSWVVESKSFEFSPDNLEEWLRGRLPNPVDEIQEWIDDDIDNE